MEEQKSPSNFSTKFFPTTFVIAGVFVVIQGLFVFGSQVYYYLGEGVWAKLPSAYVLADPARLIAQEVDEEDQLTPEAQKYYAKRIEIFKKIRPYLILLNEDKQTWYDTPQSWIGLNTIVMGILNFLAYPSSFSFWEYLLSFGA